MLLSFARAGSKNLWLVAASLLFYAFSGLWYVLLLLFSVFCNYLAGLFVSGRKSVLYAAVAVNLGILGIFKYLTFLVQTVDRLPGVTIPVLPSFCRWVSRSSPFKG